MYQTQIMRKSIVFATLFSLVAFAFTSCDKGGPTGAADGLSIIPADAGMVVGINVPALMEKADFETMKTMEFYQDGLAEVMEESPAMAEIMADPSKSGIDLSKHAYVAIDIDPEVPDNVFVAFIMSIANEGDFRSMLDNSEEGALDFTSGDGFTYATPDGNSIIAYNDSYALIGGADGYLDLQEKAKKFFDTTPETSIASNKDLGKAIDGSHDISMWISTNPIADNNELKFALSMAEIDPDALQDNFIHGSLDFLEGEMVSRGELFLQRALTKDFDKFFDDEVKTDYTRYVPKEDLLFAFTTAINSKGIDEVLSARPQTKGFIEYGLAEYGLSVSDIANTFGGDILVAGMIPENADKPAGLFAMNIEDEELFTQFMQLAIDEGAASLDGENIYRLLDVSRGSYTNEFEVTFPDGAPRLVLTDGKMFVTGHPGILEMVLDGGYARSDRADGEIPNLLGNHIFGGYFALQALGQFDSDMADMVFQTMDIQVDREESEMHLFMENDSENALRQLIEWANQMYLQEKADEDSFYVPAEDQAM
jgi:hypothetical protein